MVSWCLIIKDQESVTESQLFPWLVLNLLEQINQRSSLDGNDNASQNYQCNATLHFDAESFKNAARSRLNDSKLKHLMELCKFSAVNI